MFLRSQFTTKSYLSKMDSSKSDIGLVYKNKFLESGTSNLLFVKDEKVSSILPCLLIKIL